MSGAPKQKYKPLNMILGVLLTNAANGTDTYIVGYMSQNNNNLILMENRLLTVNRNETFRTKWLLYVDNIESVCYVKLD